MEWESNSELRPVCVSRFLQVESKARFFMEVLVFSAKRTFSEVLWPLSKAEYTRTLAVQIFCWALWQCVAHVFCLFVLKMFIINWKGRFTKRPKSSIWFTPQMAANGQRWPKPQQVLFFKVTDFHLGFTSFHTTEFSLLFSEVHFFMTSVAPNLRFSHFSFSITQYK